MPTDDRVPLQATVVEVETSVHPIKISLLPTTPGSLSDKSQLAGFSSQKRLRFFEDGGTAPAHSVALQYRSEVLMPNCCLSQREPVKAFAKPSSGSVPTKHGFLLLLLEASCHAVELLLFLAGRDTCRVPGCRTCCSGRMSQGRLEPGCFQLRVWIKESRSWRALVQIIALVVSS